MNDCRERARTSCDGGTLFLDKIGELPHGTQAKLLPVLEAGEFRRVRGNKMLRADVRIICATNRHLWDWVKTGQFREDLYYRIACFTIRMPALRERLEDIHVLAEAILERIAQTNHGRYTLSPDAIAYLRQYHYPGNVRELRNILQIAMAYCKGKITVEHLKNVMNVKEQIRLTIDQQRPVEERLISAVHREPQAVLASVDRGDFVDREQPAAHMEAPTLAAAPLFGTATGSQTIHDIEAHYIADLLNKHGGHRFTVAKIMGISERTLYRKLKKYGLG